MTWIAPAYSIELASWRNLFDRPQLNNLKPEKEGRAIILHEASMIAWH